MHVTRQVSGQASYPTESRYFAKPLCDQLGDQLAVSKQKPVGFGVSVFEGQVSQQLASQQHAFTQNHLAYNHPQAARIIDLKPDAERFYQATTGRAFGTRDEVVLGVLNKVFQAKAHKQFDQAVKAVFQAHGQNVRGVMDVLNQEYEGNGLLRLFNRSRLQRALDVNYRGEDQYQSSSWEYRKEGFYQLPANIINILRDHPYTAGPALALFTAVGFLFPTLSAMAGAGVLAYSVGSWAYHEVKAARYAGKETLEDKKQWAHATIATGEDASCIAMTLPGFRGIRRTLTQAFKDARAGYQLGAIQSSGQSSWLQPWKMTLTHGLTYENNWNGFLAKCPGIPSGWRSSLQLPNLHHTHHDVGIVQKFLMLLGLMDEILLPFARLSEAEAQLEHHSKK
jgi:hypothetical protein